MCILIVAHDQRATTPEFEYAYICPEPDSSLQEFLGEGQPLMTSWTYGTDNVVDDDDSKLFKNEPVTVRTITGEEFLRSFPSAATATNIEPHSRSNSLDLGMRHILSDSSLTGVVSMLSLGSSGATSPPQGTDTEYQMTPYAPTNVSHQVKATTTCEL